MQKSITLSAGRGGLDKLGFIDRTGLLSAALVLVGICHPSEWDVQDELVLQIQFGFPPASSLRNANLHKNNLGISSGASSLSKWAPDRPACGKCLPCYGICTANE